MFSLPKAETTKIKAEKQYEKRLKKEKKERQKTIKRIIQVITKKIKAESRAGATYASHWVIANIIYLTKKEENIISNHFTQKGYTVEIATRERCGDIRWVIRWAEKREEELL